MVTAHRCVIYPPVSLNGSISSNRSKGFCHSYTSYYSYYSLYYSYTCVLISNIANKYSTRQWWINVLYLRVNKASIGFVSRSTVSVIIIPVTWDIGTYTKLTRFGDKWINIQIVGDNLENPKYCLTYLSSEIPSRRCVHNELLCWKVGAFGFVHK